MTRPNLRVPKDKAEYSEAWQIQQEMAGLLQSVESADRQVDDKAQWKPLPTQTAAANEVPALELMIPDLESQLTEVNKNTKLAPEKKAEELKDLRTRLAESRARLAHAKAAGRPAQTFTIHNGEALANADKPSQSFYELTARLTCRC